MADNTELNTGSGGDTIATDDIGGIKHQRVKVQHGADGSATDVSTASPLPVDLRTDNLAGNLDVNIAASGASVAVTNAGMTTIAGAVSGTEMQVDVLTSALPSGAATASNQTTGNSSLSTLAGAVSGTEVQVDVLTSALPSGASTAANQTTGNASLATIAGAVSGTEVQADVLTQPARAATTDTITAKIATDALQNGTTAVTPAYAAIDAASSGDNTLIAAQGASNKIRVLAYTLIASGAVNARFEDGAGGTALSGQMNFTTNSGVSVPFCPVGHFETTANTLLNLELSGAVSVDGHITYVVVT